MSSAADIREPLVPPLRSQVRSGGGDRTLATCVRARRYYRSAERISAREALISSVRRGWADINTLAILVRAHTEGGPRRPPPRAVWMALHEFPAARGGLISIVRRDWADINTLAIVVREETEGGPRRSFPTDRTQGWTLLAV